MHFGLPCSPIVMVPKIKGTRALADITIALFVTTLYTCGTQSARVVKWLFGPAGRALQEPGRRKGHL